MTAVRVAGLADADAVARLMTALNRTVGPVYGVPNTPENQRVIAEQARSRMTAMVGIEQVLLAEAGRDALGLLSLRIVPYLAEDAPYAEVTELFIEAGHRRHGLARQLMAEAERIAAARGCTLMHVNVWHDNAEAQAFYRATGYEAIEGGFEKHLGVRAAVR